MGFQSEQLAVPSVGTGRSPQARWLAPQNPKTQLKTPTAYLAKKGTKSDTNCLNFPPRNSSKRGTSAGYAPLSTGKVDALPPAPAGAKAGNVSNQFKVESDRFLSDVLNGKKANAQFYPTLDHPTRMMNRPTKAKEEPTVLKLADLLARPNPTKGNKGFAEKSCLKVKSGNRQRSDLRVRGLTARNGEPPKTQVIEYNPSILEQWRVIRLGACARVKRRQEASTKDKLQRCKSGLTPDYVLNANILWRKHGYAMGFLAGKPVRFARSRETAREQKNPLYGESLVSRIHQVLPNTPECIGDTGATFHMIGKRWVTKRALEQAMNLHHPEVIATASGDIEISKAIPITMSKLALKVKTLLLEDDVQPILSIGQLVMKEGFDFVWRSGGQLPFLEDRRRGIRIVFHVRRFVPHLNLFDPRSFKRIQKSLHAVSITSSLNGATNSDPKAKAYAGSSTSSRDPPGSIQASPRDAGAASTNNEKDAQKSENSVDDGYEADVTDEECDNLADIDERTAQFCGKYSKARLLAEARSIEHQLTHHPKNPYCPVCRRAKATRVPARRKDRRHSSGEEAPKRFGDRVAGDIIVDRLRDNPKAPKGSRPRAKDGSYMGFNLVDYYSDWIEPYPLKTRDTDQIVKSMENFQGPITGPRRKIQEFRADQAAELKKAAEKMKWHLSPSTPFRSTTNAIAERANRRVLDGTRALLFAAGMTYVWWHLAVKCFAWLYNVTDRHEHSRSSPHFLRHKVEFKGLRIPF